MSQTGLQLASIPHERDVVLTIGTFDGVHLGHRHLVQRVVRRARERGCLSGAVTFHPHPRAVVTGDGPAYLTCLDERLAQLRGLGLDIVAALPFTKDLAQLSAFEFMSLLGKSVCLRELWVGTGFALGRRREGTIVRLAEIGRELGFQVHTLPPLLFSDLTVSSTLIREMIRRGQVEAATRLLGRPHQVSGIAVPGDQRDNYLGLSTIAVVVSDGLAVPSGGVYVGRVQSADKQWSATVHVEPHRVGTPRRLQASMQDFPDDLLGKSLQVQFVRCLRAGMPVQTARSPRDTTLQRGQVLSFAQAGS